MIIDLRTVAILTGITYSLLTICLILQFILNKTYRGLGWWAGGCLMLASGSVLLLFRDIKAVENISIFFANMNFLIGFILLYAGTMRFINRKEDWKIIITVFSIFLLLTWHVIFIRRDDNLRVVILYSASLIFIFLIAFNLFFNRIASIKISANFTAAAFLIFGSFFLFRVMTALTSGYIEPIFEPGIMSLGAFLFSIIAGILWTFGFVIMVNQRLNREIQNEKESFEHIFYSSPDATVISRYDDRIIVNVNEGFTSLFGFTADEAIGKTSIELNIWSSLDDRTNITGKLDLRGFCRDYEAVMNNKNGKKINVIISAKKIRLQGVPHILIITHDITERKQSEEKIKTLLAEKELILKEVHHRIKNNMSNIKGLLYLQAETLTDAAAIAALNDAQRRIESMMLLYDKLYRSDGFQELPVNEYLPVLVAEIISNFSNRDIVKIENMIDDFVIDTETLFALGIIINEIITNIMKYAFTGRESGVITIIASSIDSRHTIVIGDNGSGMPEEIDFSSSSSFGLQLINTLVKQIKGTIRMERSEGTRFIIDF
ncbi:MAG TPA: histidine kinase dimerization/phosphoacceptor domain -containing protein [Spirochaetota bacterium]|nr:histidine kinase dimerization/phosphoacceptor domain -containing protein [Spirochaetota bacterium]HPR39010.1 histidine kinase dimerization/phosphoacceptor domain -containing protein [Spirochaetota bacterium]HRX48640.1 histidine kinase dimerization/phosphoacceptor domain -containing protein [Spirochaetota bacterium]